MSKNAWMPLYVGDYLADTGNLTTSQHGAYLLLMMHYWRKGGLPDDDKQLAAIAKLQLRIWLDIKETIQAFFHDGWKHKRIDAELAKREKISQERAAAGSEGGKQRGRKREASASILLEQNGSMPQSPSPSKSSEADASGAEAPDLRTRLFREGLAKVAAMTGKGPDSCRTFVGKCLKEASDDAGVVLGLIEDAERNRVVDPAAWIAARLKGTRNGQQAGSKIIQAADDLRRKIASFDGPAGAPDQLRGGPIQVAPRLLPHR